MRRFTFRLVIALLACLNGVAAVALWFYVTSIDTQKLDDDLALLPQVALTPNPVDVGGKPVRMHVWNESDEPVHIKVVIDGYTVYESVVRSAQGQPMIVAYEENRLSPGTHRVELIDETRRIRREARMELLERANIKVRLEANDTMLEIGYVDEVYQ